MNTRVDLTWLTLRLAWKFKSEDFTHHSSFFLLIDLRFVFLKNSFFKFKISRKILYDKISSKRPKNIREFFTTPVEEIRKYTIPWNVLTSFTKLSRRFKSFPLFASPLSATRINSTSWTLVHATYLLMNINDRTDVTGKSTRVGIVDRAQRARGKLHN